MKSLEELLTILYDPSSVRGQRPFNHRLKLDSNSHSLNDSHIEQISPYSCLLATRCLPVWGAQIN